MKQAVSQSLLILALAVVLSVVAFVLRPEALPWSATEHEVDLEAARLLDGALWVDARVEEDFKRGHLNGAISVNEENWEMGFMALLEVWTPGSPIVVYCSSQSCLRSHHVAERLREELGVEEAFALDGGWEAMVEVGLVEGGDR
ncbi:rhodanese-like domain protein [Verrucomicrobiia bacterium DG1235]|nr:rhodanese-like domain protein [Verrucomicrobiae bacterium DG1235]